MVIFHQSPYKRASQFQELFFRSNSEHIYILIHIYKLSKVVNLLQRHVHMKLNYEKSEEVIERGTREYETPSY
jgi:hypothetical protein